MFKASRWKLPVAGLLLGMACTAGVALSAQRYLLLQVVEDALQTQKALDESFMVAVNAGTLGPKASQSGFASTVAIHLEQTADIRRAVSQLNASIQTSEILSASLWTVTLIGVGLSAVRRRKTSGPLL